MGTAVLYRDASQVRSYTHPEVKQPSVYGLNDSMGPPVEAGKRARLCLLERTMPVKASSKFRKLEI